MTIYHLPLPSPLADYDYVELTSERASWVPSDSGDSWAVVWLDLAKVKAFTIRGGQSWPQPLSNWPKDKLAFFKEAWDPLSGRRIGTLAHMPRISCDLYVRQPNMRSRIIAATRRQPAPEPQATFTVRFGNGRHRTEYFLSQGVTEMPFETRSSKVALLLQYCSSK